MTGRFLEIFLKYSFVKIWPPLWPHYISWNGYKQYWIYTIWWYFNINFNITSRMVFERQFFRDLPYTFLSKYSTPLWPHPSLGDKIFFQKLNVHYLGKPHYQFQIYWPTGILGKEFLKGQYFFKKISLWCILYVGLIVSFEQTWILLFQKFLVQNCFEISPVVLEKWKCEKFTSPNQRRYQ